MKSGAVERRLLAYVVALLAAAIPVMFTACRGGFVAPSASNTSQQSVAPTITSVVPSSGPPSGGTVTTINGANFTSGSQQTAPTVIFGGTQATNVMVISSSQLSVTIPAHTAGSVSVQVTTADGQSSTLTKGFTYITATFNVSSVSPISGPSAGGTAVTISGAGFQSGVSVTIGGLAATSVTLINSTTISAGTPAHASGGAEVTVTNSDGQSASLPSGFMFHSINLLWSAPSTSSVTIAGYDVYRGLSSTGPFGRLNGSTPIADTSFDDLTVQGSTTYYYEVTSVDPNGTESTPDGPVPATTSP